MGLLRTTSDQSFNPRSREGSDCSACLFCLPFSFQSTLPRRERHRLSTDNRLPSNVSIHAPAKGATKSATSSSFFLFVSIHAPAKGATMTDFCNADGCIVSIHAPAKGATAWYGLLSSLSPLFQSTLPRRERLMKQIETFKGDGFNPRSREGSDNARSIAPGTPCVSIHAPAKGATIRS